MSGEVLVWTRSMWDTSRMSLDIILAPHVPVISGTWRQSPPIRARHSEGSEEESLSGWMLAAWSVDGTVGLQGLVRMVVRAAVVVREMILA